MKKNLIFIIIIIVCAFLSGCTKVRVSNGGEHFLYTKYIDKNDKNIMGINIPLISKTRISEISLQDVNITIGKIPTFHIEGFIEYGEYLGYYAYSIRLDISDIDESFIIDKFIFIINKNVSIEYLPKAFVIVKSDYEIINHDYFKLYTHIVLYQNIPSKITYKISSDNYKIIDIKSLHLIENWNISKEKDINDDLSDYIDIFIEKIECDKPLYVNFNFQFILSNEENEKYSYLDNIEINLLYMDCFKEIINDESQKRK